MDLFIAVEISSGSEDAKACMKHKFLYVFMPLFKVSNLWFRIFAKKRGFSGLGFGVASLF